MSRISKHFMLGAAAVAMGLAHVTPVTAMPMAPPVLSDAVKAGTDTSSLVEVRRGRNRRAAVIGGTALGVGLLAGAAIANSSRHDPYYDYDYGYAPYYDYSPPPVVYRAPPRRVYRERVYEYGPAYYHQPYQSSEEQWFDQATGD